MLSLAFKYVESEGVEGDYAEFGVWQGDIHRRLASCQEIRFSGIDVVTVRAGGG